MFEKQIRETEKELIKEELHGELVIRVPVMHKWRDLEGDAGPRLANPVIARRHCSYIEAQQELDIFRKDNPHLKDLRATWTCTRNLS